MYTMTLIIMYLKIPYEIVSQPTKTLVYHIYSPLLKLALDWGNILVT